MDCRSFRRHHLAYLDNTLPGELLVAAECHVIECEDCARHDTAVRRALMLARNLAPIEPSADFQARLEARLRAELATGACRWARGADRDDAMDGLERTALIHRALGAASEAAGSRTRAAVLAAGLLFVAYAAGATLDVDVDPADAHRAPAVATLPAPEPMGEIATPDLVTSASTGVSVWPAALLADQVPAQFMGAQFQLVSYGQ
jgi:hypothetical protein